MKVCISGVLRLYQESNYNWQCELQYYFLKWFRYFVFIKLLLLIELIFGVKLVITGDKVDVNDCPLIMMNHRCRLDYMFYWMVLLRNGRLANEKIIMKNELKYMPALGEFSAPMFTFCQVDGNTWKSQVTYANYWRKVNLIPHTLSCWRQTNTKSSTSIRRNSFQYIIFPDISGNPDIWCWKIY